MIDKQLLGLAREWVTYRACARASRFLVDLSFRVPPHRTGVLAEIERLQRRATIRAHTARKRVEDALGAELAGSAP